MEPTSITPAVRGLPGPHQTEPAPAAVDGLRPPLTDIPRLGNTEARYRALFESMDEGFLLAQLLYTPQGQPLDLLYLDTNRAARQLTGVELKGRRATEISPDLEPGWLETWARVARTRVGERHQRYAAPLGRWFDFNLFAVGEPSERQVAVVFQDITRQKQAEQTLQESEARHAFLVRLGDQLRDLSHADQIERRAVRLLGEHLGVTRAYYVRYDEHIGRGILLHDYVAGKGTPPPPSLVGSHRIDDFPWINRALRNGRPFVLPDVAAALSISASERALYAPLGIQALLCVPVLREDRLVGAMTVACDKVREWTAFDVSIVQETAERMYASLKRAHAEAALREANRRKDEFLATLAHELRNPLAPLRNGLQITKLTLCNDTRLQGTVDVMDRQLSHLIRLVDDLLDVGRISSGKLELRKKRLRLSEVLASSVELSRESIAKHGHALHVADDAEGLHVEGDFDRLAQVFTNLLSNAAKYTDQPGHIRLRLHRDDERVQAVVTVTDSGIGIPPADLPHVFDLFSQVRSHQGLAEGGLGIGLSLVKQLVDLHGGQVEARSGGAGQGSCFTVRLPLAAAPPALEAQAEAHAPPPAATLEPPQAPASRKRVLVADDNADGAASLALLLELLGHEVCTAKDGVEAVEKAVDFKPDLVLLDLGMPRMDGFAAARQLRAMTTTRHTALVALTGWGQDTDRHRTRAAGFDAHLVKPVDAATLDALLKTHA